MTILRPHFLPLVLGSFPCTTVPHPLLDFLFPVSPQYISTLGAVLKIRVTLYRERSVDRSEQTHPTSHCGVNTFSTPTPTQLKITGLPPPRWPMELFAVSKGGRGRGIVTARDKAVWPAAGLLNPIQTWFPYLRNALILPAQPASQAGLEDQIKHT